MKEAGKEKSYEVFSGVGGLPVKSWTVGVSIEPAAKAQLLNVASLPFIHKWVAAMPDVHLGKGATIGSVIPTRKAIIPAAVGVDIGCGMMAVKTNLKATHLPDAPKSLRLAIERAVPHGRSAGGGVNDKGKWRSPPKMNIAAWAALKPGYDTIISKHKAVSHGQQVAQLGTLGSGNHFIEVCVDEESCVWFMLHSGSRGVGNRIGTYFIEKAKETMRKMSVSLPDSELAYLPENSKYFNDYIEAVGWAQQYAKVNRELMMQAVIDAVRNTNILPPFDATLEAVNCHHNYVSEEQHYGETVYVTRKGAVRARRDELGIIPGSMGAKSFIVRGLGNAESFHSCSHGAGRVMSRNEAKRRFSIQDHIEATSGVECRKDKHVIDETPGAYKPIESVMNAQRDLVEIVHTLKQVVCVKG